MLKNKKIIIISLIFLILFSCVNSCFATTDKPDYTFILNDNRTIVINNMPTTSNHFIVQYWDFNGWYCITEYIGSDFAYYKQSGKYIYAYNSEGMAITDSSYYNTYQSKNQNADCTFTITPGKNSADSNYITYFGGSSDTIYLEDNTIFFQLTPPVTEELQIVKLTQVEEIPKAIVETLKKIIPVGLVVLSIFLIIYLMKLVIFLQM